MKAQTVINFHTWLPLLILLLIASSPRTFAQTYTLNQVLDSIAANNPDLQQFPLETAALFAQAEAVQAWAAPTAGIGLNEFPYQLGEHNQGAMVPRKMLMLRLHQTFPNFKQQKTKRKYYRSLSKQKHDDRATLKNILFAQAKNAYFKAYVAERKLTVVRHQEKQIDLLIQIATGRLQYGKARLPDIYKARAKRSDLKAMEIQLRTISNQSAAVLNSLMNLPQQTPFQIDTTNHIAPVHKRNWSIDRQYILSHRTDIIRTSDAIRSLHLNKSVVAGLAMPTFSLNWDNMRMNDGGYMYNLMASLSIPIAPWFSKGYQSKAREIDYKIQAMQKKQEGQLQKAIGNIQKYRLKLQAAQKEVQLFENEIIPAYSQTYQSYLNAYSENTASIFETIAAWNELTIKKIAYWDKIGALLNIRVALETALQVNEIPKQKQFRSSLGGPFKNADYEN